MAYYTWIGLDVKFLLVAGGQKTFVRMIQAGYNRTKNPGWRWTVRELLEQKPILNFFAQVLGMVLFAAVVVVAAGLVLRWSNEIDYSDGFFYACVGYAAVGVVRSWVTARAMRDPKNPVESPRPLEPGWNRLEGWFARTSLDFRLLMAAGLCLLISILITQI